MVNTCVVCAKPAKSRCDGSRGGPIYKGPLCAAHYEKLRRNGDPLKKVPWGRQKGQTFRKPLDKRYSKGDGYFVVWCPQHPNADKNGNLAEHRWVMSEHLGRPLKKDENVHHLNGDKGDNTIGNLELWSTSQPKGQRVKDKVRWAKDYLVSHGFEITGNKECE